MRQFLTYILLVVSISAYADGSRCIVLRPQFRDVGFTLDESSVKSSCEGAGEYLSAQLGALASVSFELGPVVTLDGTRSSYASNSSETKDARIGEAIREACLLSDDRVDFSKYDCLAVMFPGESEADGGGLDCVWPQQNTISALTLDGRKLEKYIDFTETGKAGIICHEYLHLLGLQDMYDTDGDWSGGLSKGLWGSTSVMDRGMSNNGGLTPPNLNAIELEFLGLGECISLSEGQYTLPPLGKERRYLRYNCGIEGEYFLIECRQARGWDEYAGGSGLLVYHIDKSSRYACHSDWFKRDLTGAERWQYNEINCNPAHECAKIVEASESGIFYPHGDIRSLSSDSNPGWTLWNGSNCDLALTDIRLSSDGPVSFNVIRPITLTSTTVFQDAVILEWSVDKSLEGCSCELSWTGISRTGIMDVIGEGRNYAATVEGLSPGSAYSFTISVNCPERYSSHTGCTTKTIRSGASPYIWLNGSERRNDGSFMKGSPILLKVYDAADVADVRWFYDGHPITPGSNGLFTPASDGELKAVINYRQGGKDIIVKKIKLK